MDIGKEIKEWRKSKGMTLYDLECESGYSLSHICKIENGCTTPSFYAAVSILKALGLTLVITPKEK